MYIKTDEWLYKWIKISIIKIRLWNKFPYENYFRISKICKLLI